MEVMSILFRLNIEVSIKELVLDELNCELEMEIPSLKIQFYIELRE